MSTSLVKSFVDNRRILFQVPDVSTRVTFLASGQSVRFTTDPKTVVERPTVTHSLKVKSLGVNEVDVTSD